MNICKFLIVSESPFLNSTEIGIKEANSFKIEVVKIHTCSS